MVRLVHRITLPHGLVDSETAGNAAVYRCTGPKGSWVQLWPRLSHVS